ncbi:MAG: hypothetical protein IPN76_31795 [Saprospiraceae bacterium]|nr:hypothetical protein [Saprospiraceae bacterium]
MPKATPYDMVQIRYTLGDNGGPDTDMPDLCGNGTKSMNRPSSALPPPG